MDGWMDGWLEGGTGRTGTGAIVVPGFGTHP